MSASDPRSRKRASDLMGLGLQMFMRLLMWMLGTELRSCDYKMRCFISMIKSDIEN